MGVENSEKWGGVGFKVGSGIETVTIRKEKERQRIAIGFVG